MELLIVIVFIGLVVLFLYARDGKKRGKPRHSRRGGQRSYNAGFRKGKQVGSRKGYAAGRRNASARNYTVLLVAVIVLTIMVLFVLSGLG